MLCCLRNDLSRAFPVLQLPALKVLPVFSVLKFCSRGFLGNLCPTVTKCLHIFRHRPQNRTQRCFLLRIKVYVDCRGNDHRQSRLFCLAPELLFPSHPQQIAMDGAWLCFLCRLQILLLFDQTVDSSFFHFFRAASFFSLFSARFFHPFNVHVQCKYGVESQIRTGILPSLMQ